MAQQLSPAAIAAALRYKPQHEALAEAAMAAKERFLSEVQAGKSQGLVAQQAAQRAKPAVEGVYNEAAKESGRSRNLLAPALEKLAADSPFKAAAANEAAAGAERLQGERAHAVSDVHQRGVAASQLPAFATQAAGQALAKELGTLKNKESGVLGSEALATGVQEGSERKEAAKESAAEKRSLRSDATAKEGHEITRQNSREGHEVSRRNAEEKGEIALGKGTLGANGLYKPAEQKKAAGLVGNILGEAEALKEKGKGRDRIIKILTTAVPSVSRETPSGEKESEKGHPGFSREVLLEAAIDQAEYGGVTPRVAKELRAKGYDVRRLGVQVLPTSPNIVNTAPGSRTAAERARRRH